MRKNESFFSSLYYVIQDLPGHSCMKIENHALRMMVSEICRKTEFPQVILQLSLSVGHNLLYISIEFFFFSFKLFSGMISLTFSDVV